MTCSKWQGKLVGALGTELSQDIATSPFPKFMNKLGVKTTVTILDLGVNSVRHLHSFRHCMLSTAFLPQVTLEWQVCKDLAVGILQAQVCSLRISSIGREFGPRETSYAPACVWELTTSMAKSLQLNKMLTQSVEPLCCGFASHHDNTWSHCWRPVSPFPMNVPIA